LGQQLQLKISGLKTNPSQFGAKEGALKVAKNIVIDRPNTAGSRRGFTTYGYDLDETGSGSFEGFFNYDGSLFVKYGTSIYKDDGSGGWDVVSGTYTAPDTEILTRAVENNGSFFFTTNAGLYKMESTTATPALAGVPRAIGMDLALTGTSGFFTYNTQVAYRVVWGIKDTNGVVSLGYPSERGEIANTSDETGEYTETRDVALTIYIPSGITTSYFFQVYRSGFSTNASTVANDELQLVYENNPTAAEITAGSISFTDNAPNSLRGATIYTAPSQEGILQANELPPLAKDVVMYKNYALFANTRTRHFFNLTLLSVGNSETDGGGLDVGDIITIDGVDFLAVAEGSQDASLGYFEVVVSGTAAENIRDTAQSLVQVINRYTSNTTIYAFYTSGYDELPGQMLLQRRNLTDTAFTVAWDRASTGDNQGTMWNPVLTAANQNSSNENKPNRIYVSKVQQVDAVPTLQYFDAGGEEGAIKRILALRDSAWALKDNGEIYRLVGETVNDFQLLLFDNTTKIIGARTAVVFNNQIMCFSEQGVVAISDSGVAVKSWDIEDQLKTYFASSTFPNNAFGVSYESERKYLMETGTEMFCYNSFTNAWTKWDIIAEAAFVNPTDDKMYLGRNDGFTYKERKNFNKFDYADNDIDVTIVSSSGTTVTVDPPDDISDIVVGNVLRQGNTSSPITAVVNLGTLEPIDYTTSGTDVFLTSPDGAYDTPATNIVTASSFVGPPPGELGDMVLSIGDHQWSAGGLVSDGPVRWPDKTSGTTYGQIVFSDDADFGGWGIFAPDTYDGLQTFTLPRTGHQTSDGGYFQYYYKRAAWISAFNGSKAGVVIAQNGSVYRGSIGADNLVVRWDGETGPAAGGTATDTNRQLNLTLTVEDSTTWYNAAATINEFIDCELQWLEIYADNPGMMKKWKEMTVFFRDMNEKFDVIFSNNFDNVNKVTQEITPTYIGAGWGSLPWGDGPWGGNASGNQENRTYFPIQFMRALWQNVKIQTNRAFTNFTLNAISIIFEEMDTEFTKVSS
jgi:hypothetical protein